MADDPVGDVAAKTSGFASKVWGFTKGALPIVFLSTAIGVATGGASLTGDAIGLTSELVLEKGAEVATTSALELSMSNMGSVVLDSAVHNLQGLASGLDYVANLGGPA